MNIKRSLVLVTVALLLSGLVTVTALADSSGESEGTVTVSSAVPSLDNIQLTDLASADKNDTALNVNQEYWLIWNVTDANTMEELDNCTVYIYDDRSANPGDSDAEREHFTYTWVESTDTWACPVGASFLVGANCTDPGTDGTETEYEFRLAFILSKVANYSNGGSPYDWKAQINVYDDAANSDTEDQIQHGVASYFEISITDTTHSFGSLAPGTSDNEVQSEPIDFTVIANTQWKAQVQSNASTLIDGSGHNFNIGNITVYGSDTVGSSVALTTTYADLGALTDQSPPSAEGSPSSVGVYAWIDIPAAQFSAVYQYKLQIQVVIHS